MGLLDLLSFLSDLAPARTTHPPLRSQTGGPRQSARYGSEAKETNYGVDGRHQAVLVRG